MFARRNRRRRPGFTLMEILLVLAILVVLGSMVTVGFVRMQRQAYIQSTQSQISLLETAVNAYTLNIGMPPSTQQGLEALLAPPADIPDPNKWMGPYLNREQLPLDPWGNPFQYEQVDSERFRIWSPGPDRASGTEDDVSSTL
jgi:general secretion pathway protein G